MRTSNKILLSAFLIGLLIVLGIYVAIYIKYKRADFTSLENVDNAQQFEVKKIAPVKVISLYGLQNCVLIPSDSMMLKTELIPNNQTYYLQVGDSLYISTDTIVPGLHFNFHVGRQRVKIYIPNNINQIIARGCELSLNGNEDSSKATSISFTLYDSWLKVGQAAELNAEQSISKNVVGKEYWNNLSIAAFNNSKVNISSRAHINELHASLSLSNLLDQGSTISKPFIQANKLSLVTLHGDNISRIVATSK